MSIEDVLAVHPDRENLDESTLKKSLSSMMNEQIGVEIIPAVLQGETRKEAFSRLRHIFVDVNQNAKKLESGELALISEDDGFSIVARKVMVSNALFVKDNELRVETKRHQLPETSENYTTLQTIVSIASWYLGQQPDFKSWEDNIAGIQDAGKLRPQEEELDVAQKMLSEYFDAMRSLPSHVEMINGKMISELRGSGENGEWDSILFRPAAQEALAKAVGELVAEKDIALKDIFGKISKKDDGKQSELKLTDMASPFFGVLCDPITKKMRRQIYYKNLAASLFVYLLGGGMSVDQDREELRENIFYARRTTPETAEIDKAVNYDGKDVTLEKFDLPAPW